MYRTWLIPYLEETLDAEQRRQVEARLAEDPDLAAEMESLRRAQPRLRRVVAHLRQTDGNAVGPAPLWPRLRGRLDPRPQRPARGPLFWWLGGACAAGAALLAVLTLTPKTQPPTRDKQLVRELKRAPLLVFHRNNGTGTVVAEKLQKRAVRVALAKRAVNPHVAAVMAKADPHVAAVPTKFKPLPVAPPAAPPLPNIHMTAKLPMPVTPPFQMAKREDGDQGGPYYAVPAPKHSPLRDALQAKVAERSFAGGAVPPPVLNGAVPPPPKHSPLPMHGPLYAVRAKSNAYSMVSGGAVSNALKPAPMPMEKNRVSGDGPAQNGPPIAAAPIEAGARVSQALAGAAAQDALGAAAPLRERLERTVTPPLYGTPAGAQELQKLLQSARLDGTLDALAGQVEQGPVDAAHAAAQEAVNGRLLAAIYEAGADLNRALAERRRVALLAAADGEDWFELAQTEERLGNVASAQRAYAQALRAGGAPLAPAHRAVAHQNLP